MDKILNIQKAILGNLILADEIAEINLEIIMDTKLSSDWFSTKEFGLFFNTMKLLYNANKKFDDKILLDALKKNEDIDFNPEPTMIDILLSKMLSQNLILEYIELLKVNFEKSNLLKLSDHIKNMMNEDKYTPETIVQFIQNSIDNFSFMDNKGDTKSLTQIREIRKNKPPAVRIKTRTTCKLPQKPII